ncbi:MAG: VWA domain-containing protein [Kiritimatiellae bacterium]|nr:VWA domain-containing protein [Kiritimatiellia bacterium]
MKPDRGQIAAAALAVALSVLIHVFAVVRGPRIDIGLSVEPVSQEPVPPFRLAAVNRLAPQPDSRPDRFKPEDPALNVELARQADALERPVDEVVIEPRAVPENMLGSGGRAVEPPALPPPAEPGWEPRQEVLQIEERLFSDVEAALPRRYMPEIERVPRARDITAPADRATAEIKATWREGAAGAGLAGTAPARVLGGAAGAQEPVELVSREILGGVRSTTEKALVVKPKETETYEPVENLLALDVHAYTSRRDPDLVYFGIQIRRAGAEVLPVLPKDVVFIQDCSSSISEQRLFFCKEGLVAALAMLGSGDRFNVVGFQERSFRCFEQWTPNSPAAVERAARFINAMESRGKTDIYASLQELFQPRYQSTRPVVALLVTDGLPTAGMTDNSEIIEQFSVKNDGGVSMFTLGTARSANAYLLDLLSFRNKGDAVIVRKGKWDIPGAIRDRTRGVSRPILTNLKFRFATGNRCEAYPREPSDLYLDRPLELFGRCPANAGKLVLQIVGRAGTRKYDMVFTVNLDTALPGNDALREAWAWQRIYDLIGRHTRTASPSVLAEIDDTARTYGLKVPYKGELGRQ